VRNRGFRPAGTTAAVLLALLLSACTARDSSTSSTPPAPSAQERASSPGSAAPATKAESPAPGVTLAHTEQRAITASKIGQRYELLVSLPDDYATSGKSYPVLYVLDGWHFPFLAFLQNNNIYSERMPPVIIVNVSHGDVGAMTLRARDFTPTKTDIEPGSGGASAFLDFLEQELIPFVDRTYRTQATDRGLLGHSYGGLFALYALEQRPALFQRIVAASPVVGWDHRFLFAARERLKALPAPVRLDLSAGSDEVLAADVVAFAKLLDEIKPGGLDYRSTIYPGENHNSVRLASFPRGLYWVYRPAGKP
jgi:predicted alpha/beta superfamily hydrolase